MRQELQDLKEHIYQDGEISESEVKLLGDYFKAKFDEEEARLLLNLNNILSGGEMAASFADLYVNSLAGYVVKDGRISDAHWAWLYQELHDDHQVDAIEKRLLAEIASRLKEVPASMAALLK
ncbi:MAG: hypothetical protein EPN26_16950 [Rhodospirillales bacterium]|nr:MAG: hypothetical protein EPN26_16950 [Rhodospirillales bacterium]